MDWDSAVLRITGPLPREKPQGTGFVVWQDDTTSLVVTCWHVVNTIGRDRLHIKKNPCQLVSKEGDDVLDLAVLSVSGLPNIKPLTLLCQRGLDLSVSIYGYCPTGRCLSGRLGQPTRELDAQGDDDLIYWDYYLDEQADYFQRIKDGYSGSPVYDPASGHVVAVVTHRVGENKGFAIDMRELVRVYDREPTTWLPTIVQPLSPGFGEIMPLSQGFTVERTPPSIREDALTEIEDNLNFLPPLRDALSQVMTDSASELARPLAERLCALDAGAFQLALKQFREALDKMRSLVRQGRVDAARLHEGALDILGWMLVTTVLDGYDEETKQAVQAWRGEDGVALRIPFERSHCIEVLSARWLRRQARFGAARHFRCTGEDDLMDRPLGESGFDDPFEHSSRRLVDEIWKLLFQKFWPGDPIPLPITSETQERIRTLMEGQRESTSEPHWYRLVIAPGDLHYSAFTADALREIATELPLLQLIVIADRQGEGAATEIFLIPPGRLAGQIDLCLKSIDALR